MSDRVRRLPATDIEAWVSQMTLGFHYSLPEEFPAYLLTAIDLERTWAGYDGDKIVGTLRSFANTMSVPGGNLVPTAALTNVTVAPTHRRRGILSEMIASDLRASKDAGQVLGALVASEWPIYGRFGYGPAIYGGRYEIDSKVLAWREHPAFGSFEVADRVTMRTVAPEIFDRWQVLQPGAIGRSGHWWDRALQMIEVPGDDPDKKRSVIYRGPDGTAEGYVRYETKPDWEAMRPKGTLTIRDLVATTATAYQALFTYCANVDLLTTIEASDRPVDEVLPLLLVDGRHVRPVAAYDFVWLRVLDIKAALEARSYIAEGRIVLEVTDSLGLAEGRFVLDAGTEGSTCEPTNAEPDIVMPIDSLGSVYLGGESFVRLLAAGRLAESSPRAAMRADAMFRGVRAPWCNTWF